MSDINYSVAAQHLAQAVDAVLIADNAEHRYGYATLTGTADEPDLRVYTFPDHRSMNRALSETLKGRLLPDLFHTTFRIVPDRPLRLRMVIEEDDEAEGGAPR